MFNLTHGFAGERRYKYTRPVKMTIISRISTKTSRKKDKDKKWYMGDVTVTESDKTELWGF